jgi:hypothetical protein
VLAEGIAMPPRLLVRAAIAAVLVASSAFVPSLMAPASAVGIDTAVSLTTSINPSAAGQAVTLKAKVVDPVTPASAITGSVTFADAASSIATVSVTNGVASFTTRALSAGVHTLTATFTDATTTTPIVSALLTQTVYEAATTTTVTSTRPSAPYGASGNVVAAVKAVAPGAGIATGSVDFFVDGSWYWTAPLDGTGKARLALGDMYSSFMPGTYVVTAAYAGDGNYAPSTTATGVAQTFVGISESPITTLTLNTKGKPVFTPRSFTLSSVNPLGCDVTIVNNTPYAQVLAYGTPGAWKRLPNGVIPAGAARGVGVGISGYTGYFTTTANTANYVAIHCT